MNLDLNWDLLVNQPAFKLSSFMLELFLPMFQGLDFNPMLFFQSTSQAGILDDRVFWVVVALPGRPHLSVHLSCFSVRVARARWKKQSFGKKKQWKPAGSCYSTSRLLEPCIVYPSIQCTFLWRKRNGLIIPIHQWFSALQVWIFFSFFDSNIGTLKSL